MSIIFSNAIVCRQFTPQGGVPSSSVTVTNDELNSDHIDIVLELMREQFGGELAGLQSSLLGQCTVNKSLPKFSAASDRRFVQILNVGDHWVTVSNRFSYTADSVFVFDSLYTQPSRSLLLQVSALLRSDENPDQISFHFRDFQKQPMGSRLCGYYAVAAAVSCVLNVDPTSRLYDETLLKSHFQDICASRVVTQFPSCPMEGNMQHGNGEVVHTLSKLHCICQQPDNGSEMIRCDGCHFWFHLGVCVSQVATPRTLQRSTWFGPCCTVIRTRRPAVQIDIDD